MQTEYSRLAKPEHCVIKCFEVIKHTIGSNKMLVYIR